MNPETQRVDVLAVIDAQIAITARPHEAGLFNARAAVAELIEADVAFDVARRNFAPCSDEVLEATARRSAALARIGAKS